MSATPPDDPRKLKKDELDKLKAKARPQRKEKPQTQRATNQHTDVSAKDLSGLGGKTNERPQSQTGGTKKPAGSGSGGKRFTFGTAPEPQHAQRLKLTIDFIREDRFSITDYDLTIVPYDDSGLPAPLKDTLLSIDPKIFDIVMSMSGGFAAEFHSLSRYKLGLYHTRNQEENFQRMLFTVLHQDERAFFGNKTARILDVSLFGRNPPESITRHIETAISMCEILEKSISYTILTPKSLPIAEFEKLRKLPMEAQFQGWFDSIEIGRLSSSGNATDIPKKKEVHDTRTHFLADHATDEDLLGYHPYAMGIASFVKDRDTALPLTIAIDGAWGKGKSSLMKMLRNELDPNRPDEDKIKPHRGWLTEGIHTAGRTLKALFPRFTLPKLPKKKEETEKADRAFITVFVNAWRHGHGTRLKATMVNEIIQSLTARLGPDFLMSLNLGRIDRLGLLNTAIKSAFTNSVTLLLALAVTLGLVVSDAYNLNIPVLSWDLIGVSARTQAQINAFPLASGTIGATFSLLLLLWRKIPSPDLNQYLDQPDYLTLMGDDARVEEDFRRILSVLKDRGLNLALFVDDLDRCSPGECAAVVEALNTFFGQEKHECLFVLGMHREMVASALEVAYKDLVDKINSTETLREQRPFGRRFLEKIVQFIVALPEPDDDATKDFLDALTEGKRRGSLDDIKALEAAQARESGTPPKDRSKIIEFLDDLGSRFASFGNDPFVASAEVIMEHLARKGVDVEQAKEDARKMGELKDRIEERKNANENDYVAAFKEVRDVIRANPRQYKRFFNKLRFYRLLNVAEDNPMFVDACEAVLALEHPELHYRVVKNAGSFAAFSLKVARIDPDEGEDKPAVAAALLLQGELDGKPGLQSLREKLAKAA